MAEQRKTRLRAGEKYRKDGRYEYRYTDHRSGQRHSIYGNSLAELREKEDRIHALAAKGYRPFSSRQTLNELFDKWIEIKRETIRINTAENYKYMYDHFVRKEFGKNIIGDLVRSDIKCFYNRLAQKMEVRTVDSIHTVIHGTLEMAVEDNILPFNPATNAIKALKLASKKKAKVILTRRQEDLFFEFLEQDIDCHRWYTIFRFLDKTGLRIGELTALQREDIDFEKRTITINKDVAVYTDERNGVRKTAYVMNDTKTLAGNRQLYLTDLLADLVKEELLMQKAAGIRCVSTLGKYKNFLFLTKNGTFYHDVTANRALYRCIQSCNEWLKQNEETKDDVIPRFSCHMFRHVFNSRMQEAGIPPENRMKILGQEDEATNMKVYTHVADESIKRDMEKMHSE